MTKPTKLLCAQRRLSLVTPLCAQWVAKDPGFLHADSEDSDITGQMPRLIRVFAGRTCHFVGFVMRRLKYIYTVLGVYRKGCSTEHYHSVVKKKMLTQTGFKTVLKH